MLLIQNSPYFLKSMRISFLFFSLYFFNLKKKNREQINMNSNSPNKEPEDPAKKSDQPENPSAEANQASDASPTIEPEGPDQPEEPAKDSSSTESNQELDASPPAKEENPPAKNSDLIVTIPEANPEPEAPAPDSPSAPCARKTLKENLRKEILKPGDIDISFDEFPYYLSETTKNALISSAYVSLKCPKFTKRISSLPAVSPRILLSGPSGSDIYKEKLAMALAKFLDAKLLIVDFLSLRDCEEIGSKQEKEEEKTKEDDASKTPSAPSPDKAADKNKSTKSPKDKGEKTLSDDKYAFKELFEVASSESKACPLIIYMKKTTQGCLKVARDMTEAMKAAKRNFPENTLLIGSSMKISEDLPKHKLKSFQFLRVEGNLKCSCLTCLLEKSEEIRDLSIQLQTLFPHEVNIQPPEDVMLLEAWKKQLDSDVGTFQAQSNVATIRSVLQRYGMDCVDLETVCVKDEMLTLDIVEKIVGWAASHHLMNNSDSSHDQPKILISSESINYAVKIVLEIKNDKKGVNKLKDEVVTDNSYEKKLLDDVISPKDIGVSFDDIGSLETVKRTLKELVMLPLQRPELFSRGQLMKPCKGILLFGPPGTGKTMLAKAVATEAGANFINVSVSSIISKWFGDGEKLVKAVFTLASKIAPAVIFIDEVDSMLGSRKTSGEHESMRKMKNEFMLNWDGLGTKENERVLVLAATNRPFDLDEAVIRRLPRRFMVNLPDADNREKILKVLLAKEEVSTDVDLQTLANMTDGYSGSDLKNLCITAAQCPIRELLEKEERDRSLALAENRSPPDPRGIKDVRLLNMEDLKSAHKQVSASVSSQTSDMNELIKWNELFGEGGTRKKQEPLSYYI